MQLAQEKTDLLLIVSHQFYPFMATPLTIQKSMHHKIALNIRIFLILLLPILVLSVKAEAENKDAIVPPMVSASVVLENGRQFLDVTFRNHANVSVFFPTDLKACLRWKAYYFRDFEDGFDADDIILKYPDDIFLRNSEGPSYEDILAEKLKLLEENVKNLLELSPGKELKLRIPLPDVISNLKIAPPKKKGFTIMLEPQFWHVVFFRDAPKEVQLLMLRTKLYASRIYLEKGQWRLWE